MVERGNSLALETHDAQLRFDVVEAAGFLLSNDLLHLFSMPAGRGHWPRITIDRLVVARESWQIDVTEPDFPNHSDRAERFASARRWARSRGLPRWIFVKAASEPKPFYVDFESPLYVDQLAHVLRREAAPGEDRTFKVSEMLPPPDQLWLPDRGGSKYTSELRMVLFDRMGRSNGSSS